MVRPSVCRFFNLLSSPLFIFLLIDMPSTSGVHFYFFGLCGIWGGASFWCGEKTSASGGKLMNVINDNE